MQWPFAGAMSHTAAIGLKALVLPLAVGALDPPPGSSSSGRVPSGTVALVPGLVCSTVAVCLAAGSALAGLYFSMTGFYASGFRIPALWQKTQGRFS